MDREEVTNQYLEIRGCKIKRTYSSRKDAKQSAKIMNRNSINGRLRAYSCKYCGNYHIGHIRLSREDKLKDKRINKILKNAI